jgi:hypothetical protein
MITLVRQPRHSRDFVQGLNAAADAVSNMAFPDMADEPTGAVPVNICGFQVTLMRQLCSTPPGFSRMKASAVYWTNVQSDA